MKKTWIGIGVTVAWITLGCVLIYLRNGSILDLKLNEFGDFLAGFFSPIAFMWLIIGYFQQGEELKLNTAALKLQAEELRNSVEQLKLQAEELRKSVEQQKKLVEVTDANMTETKRVNDLHFEREERSFQPIFHLVKGAANWEITNFGKNVDGIICNFFRVSVYLKNSGYDVTRLKFHCSAGEVDPQEWLVLTAKGHGNIEITVPIETAWHFHLQIEYLDGRNNIKTQTFKPETDNSGEIIFLRIDDEPVQDGYSAQL